MTRLSTLASTPRCSGALRERLGRGIRLGVVLLPLAGIIACSGSDTWDISLWMADDPLAILAPAMPTGGGDSCVGPGVMAVGVRVASTGAELPARSVLRLQVLPLATADSTSDEGTSPIWYAADVLIEDGSNSWIVAQGILVPLPEEEIGLTDGVWSAGAELEATLSDEAGVTLATATASCRSWVPWW